MKSSWNFQTPPPLPQEDNKTARFPEPEYQRPYGSDFSQSTASSIRINGKTVTARQNGRRVTRTVRSAGFAPGIWTAVICAMLCAGWFTAALFPISSYTGTPETTVPVVPAAESAFLPDSISYEMQTPFLSEHNDLIVNYRLTKSNPDIKAEISMSANASSSTDENYSYMGMPSMGFDLEEAWVSAVFPGYSLPASGIEGIQIETDADTVYSESIEDYSYLAYNSDLASPDDLHQEYRRQNPMANAQITVLSDGADTQSGVVAFEVSLPNSQESISGQVNIVYKKDGQVVFGVVHDIYSTAQSRKTFAYTPEIQVPEYDEVEVINMYGNSSATAQSQD